MIGFAVAFALQASAAWRPFELEFATSLRGQNVTVCLDGVEVKRTFAGKLGIRDRRNAVQSLCANVRGPVSSGQHFIVKPLPTSLASRNVAKAGNIAARYFREAQNADQCAGLQLAVWEAIEDGGEQADFAGGRFQARASVDALKYAHQYYQAWSTPGDAVFLESNRGMTMGQSQIVPTQN